MIRLIWSFILKWGWDYNRNIRNSLTIGEDCAVPSRVMRDNSVNVEGLSFKVMACHGGVVVQMTNYDHKTDRHTSHTHLIPDGEPVAERIGQIVSMEILRS
jgi:hypothetical protein